MENLRRKLYGNPDSIRTISGRYVDAMNPDVSQICMEDIAHALSNQCRFAGHTKTHYSVAQHCWLVSQVIDPKYAIYGLLHDAHEAYLVDLPTPIKNAVRSTWTIMEDKLDAAIFQALSIPAPDSFAGLAVKEADKTMLEREFGALVLQDHKYDRIEVWDQRTAKAMFIGRFQTLKGRL